MTVSAFDTAVFALNKLLHRLAFWRASLTLMLLAVGLTLALLFIISSAAGLSVSAMQVLGSGMIAALVALPFVNNSLRLIRSLQTSQTALREAQKNLRASLIKAEAGNVAKSAFLANMSHEIRTPMNGVLGMSELLLDTKLDIEQQKFVQALQDSGTALLKVIDEILDISRLENGTIKTENSSFNLGGLVYSVTTLMIGKAREKSIDLNFYIPPEADRNFIGDQGRIRQVLLNLLGNAIKFTEKGLVVLEVSMPEQHAIEESAVVRFDISDTGIGIAPEAMTGLFQKFSQADSTISRRYGGTGLGLAISKELVQLMGGSIGVSSKLCSGTRFHFEIPLVKAGASSGCNLPASSPPRNMGLRVLIVDDIQLNLDILARVVRSLGMEATCCIGPLEAVAEAGRNASHGVPYDIVLIDHLMPVMSGTQLAIRLRTLPNTQSARFVLITSFGLRSCANEEASLFEATLEKPLSRKSLQQCLFGLVDKLQEDATDLKKIDVTPAAYFCKSFGSRVLRVLLVDDNRINRMVIESILAQTNCEIDSVVDGGAALSLAAKHSYDVILMDIELPGLNGFQVVEELRRHVGPSSTAPVIALSAHASTVVQDRCLAAGMDDYLTKPIRRQTLLQKILKATNRQMDAVKVEDANFSFQGPS